jgi:hypothetical protein
MPYGDQGLFLRRETFVVEPVPDFAVGATGKIVIMGCSFRRVSLYSRLFIQEKFLWQM